MTRRDKQSIVWFGRGIAVSLILPVLALSLSMHAGGDADAKWLCDGVPCHTDNTFRK